MKSSSQTAAPSLPAPAEDNSALTQALQSVSHLQGEIERLQTVNDELQTEMNGIEKERDFYFDKLRDIEMMLQDVEDSGKGLTAPL
jgi:microtubule-associated protein, RP/EB family